MVGHNIPVFILDVDETIIGDIRPQLNEYYIINELNIKKKHSIQYKLYKQNLDYDLKNFIIRPYFKYFTNYCKAHKIPIFIYSASTNEWLKFIIQLIEKYMDFSFQRPLFSRKHMIKETFIIKTSKQFNFVKSIEYIRPKIYKSLKKTIPNLVLYKDFNNILMFDNRIDNIIEKHLVLNCPPYNYTSIIDPLRTLTEEQKFVYASKISKILFDQILDYNSLIILIYTKYVQEFKLFTIHNKIYKEDTYWKDIVNILEHNSNISLDKLCNSNILYKFHKRLFNSKIKTI
jgi:hypothetical protein